MNGVFVSGAEFWHTPKPSNWCGIRGIRIISHGCWNDAEVIYKRQRFNVHDVEDAMWEDYLEEGGDDTDTEKFADWCKAHKELAKDYLDCIIDYRREEKKRARKNRKAA